jgi:tetratricopeptide (TPR) repeat protein
MTNVTTSRRNARAGALLALFLCVCAGCGDAPRATVRAPAAAEPAASLAQAAWRAAARVSSPIDAGRETIGVAGQLAAVGRGGLLEPHLQEQREAWIRAGLLAHAASAASLEGNVSRARALLAEARTAAGATTEWRRPMTLPVLGRAEALLLLAPPSGGTNALLRWAAAEPAERAEPAARAALQKALHSPTAPDAPPLLSVSLQLAQALPVWMRLEIMAQAVASPVATAAQREMGVAAADALCGTNDVGRTAEPDVLANLVWLYGAGGREARAGELRAQFRARLDEKGFEDLSGAWTCLARLHAAQARPDDAKDAFRKALDAARARPGFQHDVALARTLAAMAVSGLKWTDEEVAAAIRAAE